jgi:hypothetical protein
VVRWWCCVQCGAVVVLCAVWWSRDVVVCDVLESWSGMVVWRCDGHSCLWV